MGFTSLIAEYSKNYTFYSKSEGEWDGPNWVEGEKVEYIINCAIFSLTSEDIQRYEGLSYTTKDIKIYVVPPIIGVAEDTEEEVTLQENDKVEYQGDTYVLDNVEDRTEHSDFIEWIAVRDQGSDDDD